MASWGQDAGGGVTEGDGQRAGSDGVSWVPVVRAHLGEAQMRRVLGLGSSSEVCVDGDGAAPEN